MKDSFISLVMGRWTMRLFSLSVIDIQTVVFHFLVPGFEVYHLQAAFQFAHTATQRFETRSQSAVERAERAGLLFLRASVHLDLSSGSGTEVNQGPDAENEQSKTAGSQESETLLVMMGPLMEGREVLSHLILKS